jgi:pteridine reductase
MNENQDKPVALITGSGRRRIGNHVARALGRRGYRIALHYHRSQEDAQATLREFGETGIEAEAYQADVAQEADVNRMFDALQERFGRLDVLVTTASVWKSKRLEDVSTEDLLFNFDINTLGTFHCARRAGLMMVEQESGGVIVTIGDWAIERPYPDYAAYFVSKGAIPTLTRTLAVELAARNPRVRVNCIHPGPVMLPPGLSEQERQARIDATLVKNADDPECVVRTVLYFIDNSFVTGVNLPVDGGRTIYARGEIEPS